MKLTITKSTVYDKKKDGTPLIDKHDKPYYRVVVKTVEYGDRFLSGFMYQITGLKEGLVVDWDVKEEDYNGQPQLKFQVPNKQTEVNKALMHCTQEIAKLWTAVKALQDTAKRQANNDLDDEMPLEDGIPTIQDSELPF